MEDKTIIFKALSDLNRLRILKALQRKVLCVCEIKELLGLANSTVSQHLKILKSAGFVVEQKELLFYPFSLLHISCFTEMLFKKVY